MATVYGFEGKAYDSFELAISAIMRNHPELGSDAVVELSSEIEEFDTDTCDCDNEEYLDYESELATASTMYDPAEYWEWFTCRICGNHDQL